MKHLDTLDGVRPHVSGEELVAEHGQALLESELEPVPASNQNGQRAAIAGGAKHTKYVP